ncbi:Cse1-domain-containing protein [Globomyces pollinis-pini]|nr:Cse1-domain-containing protein [Globomyces pollinis-pini]
MSAVDQLNLVASTLLQTLHPSTRKNAESQLATLESSPAFAPILLQLIQLHPTDKNVAFAAAVYFKNFIKRKWQQDNDTDYINSNDRLAIKAGIIDLMISVPPALQSQLSESVSIIANSDFPHNWSQLIPNLVSKLSLHDLPANLGVLHTAHSIFKRWRSQVENNTLFSEIKYVMEHFAPAYLEFFKAIDSLVDQNATNNVLLPTLLETLLLLTKIFYSLNCQDLPEFFEDHMNEFLDLFQKYLVYQNPLVVSDPTEAGSLEKIKSMICEIIDMYASRYEADFTRLPQFVEIVWTLLTTTSNDPCNDVLVSKAISFITSVVKHERHRALFEAPGVLDSICRQVVLPNMTLRESDEELFEDDPIEFIRRDLEGSDTDTRRRSSADLVRGLLTLFEKNVTEIFSQHIQQSLAQYDQDKVTHWKSKDTALYLTTSLAAKTVTMKSGATSTNEYIPIASIFTNQIVPDLQAPIDNAIHPIIKVDAIKYLMIFRNQWPKATLVEVMPLLMNHLASSNYVVVTWTAHCIERILSMKEGSKPMFSEAEMAPISNGILTKLFDLIQRGQTPEKLAENDYLMKCVLRVVVCTRGELLPSVTLILDRLTYIIREISKNPSNPKFNHYTFECLSAVVTHVCAVQPSLVESFEGSLFGPFQEILSQDVAEFTPYVFQIMSQLLCNHKEPGIPQVYMSLLPPLLQPAQWESFANIPALVNLLNSFLMKGSPTIVQNGSLPAFLGISQKLLASRLNDHHGFNLFKSIFEHVAMADLEQYAKNMFVILLTRIFGSKTPKFTKKFLDFFCFLVLLDKPQLSIDRVIGIINSIQAQPLFGSLLENVLIPEFKMIHTGEERKSTLIAMTRLSTQSEAMMTLHFAQWPKLIEGLMNLLQAPANYVVAEEVDVVGDLEEAGYQPSFTRLSATPPEHTAIQIDPQQYLAQSLLTLCTAQPKIQTFIQNEMGSELAAQVTALVNENLSLNR